MDIKKGLVWESLDKEWLLHWKSREPQGVAEKLLPENLQILAIRIFNLAELHKHHQHRHLHHQSIFESCRT